MSDTNADGLGILLPNGCRVTHGEGARVRRPFDDIPLVMHELHAGGPAETTTAYRGQYGFIPFTHELRLPRHVHISHPDSPGGLRLLPERILVVNGTAMTELNGEVLVVAHGTLVDIAPGIPHTWTACPPGVALPDGSVSDGQFLMIYDYAEPTSFSPIQGTRTLSDAAEYPDFKGELEEIRFPRLDGREVARQATLVWNKEHRAGGLEWRG